MWHKLYGAWNVACMEYKKLIRSTKMIILAMFLIFVNIQIITPLKQCAIDMDAKLSYFEPFIAAGNSGMVLLILPLFYLTMMADYPQEDESTRFYRIRCTKVMWVGGELIFASMSAVSFAIFSVVSTAILIIPKGQWIFHFSDATTKYLSVYPDRTGDAVVQLLPINLYNQVTLPVAVRETLLLLVLYFFLLALVLLLSSLFGHKGIGIIMDGFLVVGGTILCAARSQIQWLFPMAHTIPWLHYSEYYRKQVFPIIGSYLYFVAIDANLTMEEGRIYGLVGNNGSGKTMLMKCICGFVLPTKGAVLSNGKKIGKDMDYLQDAGVIIETPGFISYYSGEYKTEGQHQNYQESRCKPHC